MMEMEEPVRYPLLQCKFCARYYPAELRMVLLTHLQWHIERLAWQQAGNHLCPWKPPRKERHMKEICGQRYHKPEELAFHTLEQHTKTKYVTSTAKRYQKAWENGNLDKAHLVELLGQTDETEERLFFPKENRNGPPLRIDNIEFMALDNM